MRKSPRSHTSPKKATQKRCLRWLKWTFLVLLLLATVLHFAAPGIVTRVANQQLPDLLNTAARLGGFKMNLIHGRAEFRDLVIGQPEGFGDTPLLSLKGIRTRVPILQTIAANAIVIESLFVDQLELCIISDSNGVLNVSRLGASKEKSLPEPAESAESSRAGGLPSLLLKRLNADELSFRYLDLRLDMDITVTHFNVALSNLQIEGAPTPQITLGALDMDDLRLEMVKGAIAAQATRALTNASNGMVERMATHTIASVTKIVETSSDTRRVASQTNLIEDSNVAQPPADETNGLHEAGIAGTAEIATSALHEIIINPAPASASNVVKKAAEAPLSNAVSVAAANVDPAPVPGIWIKSVRARNFGFAYKDASRNLVLTLKEFTLSLDDIVIGTRPEAPAHGSIQMASTLDGVKSCACILADGRIGPILPGAMPVMQVAALLVGFELDTVKPITKTDATKVLGEGLDFSLMAQVNPGLTPADQPLGGRWETVTSSKVALGDQIKGTAAAPELNIAKLTGQLFIGGTFRMVGNQIGNIAAGGVEATKAVAETGINAAKGVGKTLGNTVLGIGRTVKGVATLDGEEVLGGVHDVTIGTLTNAVSTVTSTADAAGGGIRKTAESTLGSGKGDAWIDARESRKADMHKAALEWLAATPFPGTGQE